MGRKVKIVNLFRKKEENKIKKAVKRLLRLIWVKKTSLI
jgi:predicted CoA-binding protein